MKNRKQKYSGSVFSDISIKAKFITADFAIIATAFFVIFAMFGAVGKSQGEKHKEKEKMMVTASEQLMEMTIDSGVAIAKSIYINENIYKFLDRNYTSSADYYDAFYKFQEQSPLTIAETRIIKRYTIYTENSTVLNGGRISTFESELDKDWYHAYKKLNKPMILFIDSEENTVSLIRKLDFQKISTGESCIKMDINTGILSDYCDNFGFDGELYIISGGSVIYSNIEDVGIENTGINQEFESYIKNYYTADIEYYAHETRKPTEAFFSENAVFLIIFTAVAVAFIFFGQLFVINIRKRIRKATEILRNGGKPVECGRDEIGVLISECAELSEKLTVRSSESAKTHEKIIQGKSNYKRLFTSALNQWAELEISRKYPEIYGSQSEMTTLADEAERLKTAGINVIYNDDVQNIEMPVYSLLLIAGNLTADGGNLSVYCGKSEVIFESGLNQSPSKVLRINAIFETVNIPDEYEFSENSDYNSYLRLKNYFGNKVSAETSDRKGFRLIINFNGRKSDY
ncbi:MAG: hypothetical protein K2J08_02690 [Ruminococcus sp.]|nr:hypothetical protein [Ruminococcus sp.]